MQRKEYFYIKSFPFFFGKDSILLSFEIITFFCQTLLTYPILKNKKREKTLVDDVKTSKNGMTDGSFILNHLCRLTIILKDAYCNRHLRSLVYRRLNIDYLASHLCIGMILKFKQLSSRIVELRMRISHSMIDVLLQKNHFGRIFI